MRKQDWAHVGSAIALLGAAASLLRRRIGRALAFAGLAVAADAVGRLWASEDPDPRPLPSSSRLLIAVPRPTTPLRRALEPRPGERILEIGPGLGRQTIQVARAVGDQGTVEVVDLREEMVAATVRRAERRGLDNIVAAVADAADRLPFDDSSLDGAYMMSVLGEIPDRHAVLTELRRVLKPDGRLVIGEAVLDPEFIPSGQLLALTEQAGFRLERRFGPPFAYEVRFAPV